MIKNNPIHIKKLLQEGRNPILPFEKDILRLELERLGVEQGERLAVSWVKPWIKALKLGTTMPLQTL